MYYVYVDIVAGGGHFFYGEKCSARSLYSKLWVAILFLCGMFLGYGNDITSVSAHGERKETQIA